MLERLVDGTLKGDDYDEATERARALAAEHRAAYIVYTPNYDENSPFVVTNRSYLARPPRFAHGATIIGVNGASWFCGYKEGTER